MHLNNINSEYRALPQLSDEGGILLTGREGCQQKQKKSIDQRAAQIGYEGIKSLRSIAMKNYLATGGLLSFVELYNNGLYMLTMEILYERKVKLPRQVFTADIVCVF